VDMSNSLTVLRLKFSWIIDNLFPTSNTAKTLQLGIYGQNQEDEAIHDKKGPRERLHNVIDVDTEPLEN
jgi:hypothetical protein